MTRPEKVSQPPRAPSGRGRPDLKVVAPVAPVLEQQVESFHALSRELPLLFDEHWRELARDRDSIPLDPNWDEYFALSATGVLQVRTARLDGTLVGYIFNLVGPHRHYRSTKHAEIEMFWLHPACRGDGFALRWFRENDAALKDQGVSKVVVSVKTGYKDGRVGLIFKRLGYEVIETVYAKVL